LSRKDPARVPKFLPRLGGWRPPGATLHQLQSLGKRRQPRMTEGLKSHTLHVPGVNGALISPDIGVMSHIPSIVTCNALISLDIGVMSHIPSIVTCDALISLDIGVMSHIPSAVTCGFSIWTVAGSLVARQVGSRSREDEKRRSGRIRRRARR
jgi:hypothetical protein